MYNIEKISIILDSLDTLNNLSNDIALIRSGKSSGTQEIGCTIVHDDKIGFCCPFLDVLLESKAWHMCACDPDAKMTIIMNVWRVEPVSWPQLPEL